MTEVEKQIATVICTTKPISSLPAVFFGSQGYADKLWLWCTLNGIRDLPDVGLTALLTDILCTHSKGLSLEEIDLAMKMNLLGEFGEPVEAFNSLSVKFLTQIIRLYEKHRIAARRKLDAELAKLKSEPIVLSDLQLDVIKCFGVKKAFENFQNDVEIYGKSALYDFLKKLGVIEFTEADEEEEIKIATEGTYLTIKSTLDGQLRERLNSLVLDVERLNLSSRLIAQEALLIKYFKIALESGVKFNALLEEKMLAFHKITLEELNENIKLIPAHMLKMD